MAAADEVEPGSWLDPEVKKAANATLKARPLPEGWHLNTPALDAAHKKVNGSFVRTRFPPEPNGYLHIGHAKSMNMNFSLAFKKLGVEEQNRQTIFRFDDTNPEAECKEYINSIREDVAWMGWSPVKETYASDYFDELYALALQLVDQGLCYVCSQSSEEIEECREIAKKQAQARSKGRDPSHPQWPEGDPCSPFRDTEPARNRQLFEDMRKGKFDEGEVCLRMKMDMDSPNPNMFDSVAYRIKYCAHPHAGDKWCIYPTYDFTHCIQDSLEHIDFSICTLEFEARRESYYWLLHSLGLFRPWVYEMSRLNIEYVVLSKRKLLKLVNTGFFHGWDDPRMPTIRGLRRRGYTAKALNKFCSTIGVTRNENLIEANLLQEIFRQEIDVHAKRAMAVLQPIKVTITNLDAPESLLVPDFPQGLPEGDPRGAPTHTVTLTPTIYIDAVDFKAQDEADFFGWAPGKWIGLKYSKCLHCDNVIWGADGTVSEIQATMAPLPEDGKRPRGNVQWAPEKSLTFEARIYDHLFMKPQVDDDWEEQLNHESEVILKGCLVDPSVLGTQGDLPGLETHFQFERIGVFVVDPDTSAERGLVMNRTVPLKSSKPVEQKNEEEEKKADERKAKQAADLEKKRALANVDPRDMFKVGDYAEQFSQYDENGLPTHDKDGGKISKSQLKKLKKDWDKQKKNFDKAKA